MFLSLVFFVFSVGFPALSSLFFGFHWRSLLFHWLVLHVRHFFLFVHGFSLLSYYLSFVLLHFHYCSCSLFMLSLVFLRPNLAVAVAAAIASVALLVAVVIVVVVVVDLRHDGFKIKEREGGWGGGRGASPPSRWEGLDVAYFCLVVVP